MTLMKYFRCSQPHLRSILIGLSSFIMGAGASIVFILNTFLPWRQIALTCLFVPVVSVVVLLFVSLGNTNIAGVKGFSIKTAYFSYILRYPRHRNGFYQKTEQMKQKNHFNGFVDGFQVTKYLPSLQSSNDIVKGQNHAVHVSNKSSGVLIHFPLGVKNCLT